MRDVGISAMRGRNWLGASGNRSNRLDLFYAKVDIGNFGDDMNEWFWDAAFPEFRTLAPDHTMFGIGSILWHQAIQQHEKIVVMGSGTGVGILPFDYGDRINFQFVRGPKTAKYFGLDEDRWITDPAMLTSDLPEFRDLGPGHGDAILVPHCGTANMDLDWAKIGEATGLRYVSPMQDAKQVIREIAGASLVVTEAMHGAIMADSFRVPWIPVAIKPNLGTFKWQDLADSMEFEINMASALSSMKRAYGVLHKARGAVRGVTERLRKVEKNEKMKYAQDSVLTKGEEYQIKKVDKDAVKSLVNRNAGLVKRLLIGDLKRVKKLTPHLSKDAVLKARQKAMWDRFDQAKEDLAKL